MAVCHPVKDAYSLIDGWSEEFVAVKPSVVQKIVSGCSCMVVQFCGFILSGMPTWVLFRCLWISCVFWALYVVHVFAMAVAEFFASHLGQQLAVAGAHRASSIVADQIGGFAIEALGRKALNYLGVIT